MCKKFCVVESKKIIYNKDNIRRKDDYNYGLGIYLFQIIISFLSYL